MTAEGKLDVYREAQLSIVFGLGDNGNRQDRRPTDLFRRIWGNLI